MVALSSSSHDLVVRAREAYTRGDWSRRTIWVMLASRTVGFGLCQALIAFVFWSADVDNAWQRSAASYT